MIALGWSVWPAPGQLHVVPIDDLRPHVYEPRCWCEPTVDIEDEHVFVHHSMDRREEFEPDAACVRTPS